MLKRSECGEYLGRQYFMRICREISPGPVGEGLWPDNFKQSTTNKNLP